ncbi:hypothetical protein MOD25_05370 [Bacillus haynesii]|uniref:hypothetical protein n=1 Tax=Bacillus haynesii TaxID=1925021 RepID=UPI00228053AB|nr:hypothetical protein [Bacillus haynesii]MCY8549330.1 hypothetical protein [Bacillus haynesii]
MNILNKITFEIEETRFDFSKLDDWQRKTNHYRVIIGHNNKIIEVPFFTGQGWNREPDLKDVLFSLFMDAGGYKNALDFSDWCANYGYNDDSINAKKIYDTCGKIYEKLESMFNEKEYEQLSEMANEY